MTTAVEIVKVDPKEFGLEESKAAQIAEQFKPMLDKMVELEKEYNAVIAMPIDDPKTSQAANELRLKYVKVRTGTADIHKEQKAFYLAGGRFVDGWKNAQLFASQGIEEKLKEIAEHRERMEAKRKSELRESRVAELLPYGVDPSFVKVEDMTEDVWTNYLNGTKLAHEQKVEAERKAEEERLAAIKAEQERIEAQRIENERLKAEAAKRESELEAERKANEAARLKAEEEARKEREAIEAKAAADRKALEDAQAKERAEQAAKLAAEQSEKQRAEDELRKAREAEEARVKAAQEAEEARLSAGDAQKWDMLVGDIAALKGKYEMKSAANKKLATQVDELFEKIIQHIRK